MNTPNNAFTNGFTEETERTRPFTENPPSTAPSHLHDNLDDAETKAAQAKAKKANADADRAIARLHQYEAELQAELGACDNLVSDLVAYAQTGKAAKMIEREMRTQAIRTVRDAIPHAIARINDERSTALHLCNDAALAARRKTALKTYNQKFRVFEENYQKLVKLPDREKFLNAAEELASIAYEAQMSPHMREHFREKWANWYRAGELKRF